MNAIPPIINPKGKHWDQPANIRDAPMNDTHVLLTRAQLRGLMEYSNSQPSGVYDGKCWRSYHRHLPPGVEAMARGQLPGTWYLKWFRPHDTDPRYCTTEVRTVIIGKLKPEKPTFTRMIAHLVILKTKRGQGAMLDILAMGGYRKAADVPANRYEMIINQCKDLLK